MKHWLLIIYRLVVPIVLAVWNDKRVGAAVLVSAALIFVFLDHRADLATEKRRCANYCWAELKGWRGRCTPRDPDALIGDCRRRWLLNCYDESTSRGAIFDGLADTNGDGFYYKFRGGRFCKEGATE